MPTRIRKAAVLGAGLMGSQIAAHLANVGIPSLLLDIVPVDLARLAAMKPSPLYSREALDLITPGHLEHDLHRVAEVDWVVEAVIEHVKVKQDLWRRTAAYWQPGTVVSSNTSGIPIAEMIRDLPADFRAHFLGTHFFNPPRYMKLLELIPTAETDPAILALMQQFGEQVLGKGVIVARDTPNFVANRIGTYGLMVTLDVMQTMGFGPDEIDAFTGPLMGRPKSATFRTLDVVGLDTFCHVADNCRTAIPEEASHFTIPAFLREMVRRGWAGQKSGQGFFKKVGDQILTLDLQTMEYQPRQKVSYPVVEAAKPLADLKDRLRLLAFSEDRVGQFVWETLKRTLLYSAEKVGEIASDIVAIDRGMKWGFNWELGPFETWDALGVAQACARMEAEGVKLPDWVKAAAEAGGFYRTEVPNTLYFGLGGAYSTAQVNERVIDIGALRAQQKVVRSKKGATLLDMGDGVLLLETHSPKMAIGADIIYMMRMAAEELQRDQWRGLVIGARTENFCVGANVMMMLTEAQDEEWDELDHMVRQFQGACMGLKFAPKPVVAAPYGLTLGGGFEIIAGADRIMASGETYMGLVEVGVGIIPGGGGNKEMLIRALEGLPSSGGGMGGAAQMAAGTGLDLQPIVNKVFEVIGMAKVSSSAVEAREMGYLRRSDRIIANQDHLLYAAKQEVLTFDRQGYTPPRPARIPVVGPDGRAVMEIGLYNLRQSGYASDYDVHIGKKLAYVLSGGKVPAGTVVTEQYLLDLEREAIMSLFGEKKTQERMAYTLKTGKPLRN